MGKKANGMRYGKHVVATELDSHVLPIDRVNSRREPDKNTIIVYGGNMLLLMPPDRLLEHHAGDSTILFGFDRISKENTLGGSGASHMSSPFTNLTRRLRALRLFRVSPCRKGPLHLQTSIPTQGFEPRPYGTSVSAVSVANHYTGWVIWVKHK
ncbi:hypothetical protein TNCV_4739681 [Trichonephila clavipes]|nr:hypothetical protein TNCV_4739681 [Trichonephila clavipes]